MAVLYMQWLLVGSIWNKLRKYRDEFYSDSDAVVFGEIYGPKIQKLKYGKLQPELIIFDIQINGRFLDWEDVERASQFMQLQLPPVLYVGPFSNELVEEYADGPTILGKDAHIREGIVIRTLVETSHWELGRMWLKRISNKYLLKE